MHQVNLAMSCEQETSFNGSGVTNNNGNSNSGTPRTTGGSRSSNIKRQKILCLRLRVPLIKSCFCWKSLRKGSFASGIFTLAFYTIVFTTCAFNVNNVFDERPTFAFSLAMLILSGSTVITSILLIVALCGDNKTMMIPWLATIIPTTIADITYFFYSVAVLYYEYTFRNIFTAVTDLIICGLNVYAIICVISQYQEYSQGRGLPGQRYDRHGIAYTSTSIGSRCPSTGGYAIESTYGIVSETTSVMPTAPEHDEETGIASLKSPEEEEVDHTHFNNTNGSTAFEHHSFHGSKSSDETSHKLHQQQHQQHHYHHQQYHHHNQLPSAYVNLNTTTPTMVSYLENKSVRTVTRVPSSSNSSKKHSGPGALMNSCCNSQHETESRTEIEFSELTSDGNTSSNHIRKMDTRTSFSLSKYFALGSKKVPNKTLIANENAISRTLNEVHESTDLLAQGFNGDVQMNKLTLSLTSSNSAKQPPSPKSCLMSKFESKKNCYITCPTVNNDKVDSDSEKVVKHNFSPNFSSHFTSKNLNNQISEAVN